MLQAQRLRRAALFERPAGVAVLQLDDAQMHMHEELQVHRPHITIERHGVLGRLAGHLPIGRPG